MANSSKKTNKSKFHIEFRSTAQKMAWAGFQQHDCLFLSGPAGCGKTLIATAFAVQEVLQGRKKKIIITRPLVEAGEKMGFLPGSLSEKVSPYCQPMYDCLHRLLGPSGQEGSERAKIDAALEIAPIAFLRGRTMNDAVCILDEAQNCTISQLKLYLTRIGEDSKMIITGDPTQSDIGTDSGFQEVLQKLSVVSGIGIVEFSDETIVRHPIIKDILKII